MTQTQVIEGTIDEIMTQLRQDYAGQKLRVFVEPEADEEETVAAVPVDSPYTVRSHEQLLELLRDGMRGEPEPVTDREWEEMRQEVRDRLAGRASG